MITLRSKRQSREYELLTCYTSGQTSFIILITHVPGTGLQDSLPVTHLPRTLHLHSSHTRQALEHKTYLSQAWSYDFICIYHCPHTTWTRGQDTCLSVEHTSDEVTALAWIPHAHTKSTGIRGQDTYLSQIWPGDFHLHSSHRHDRYQKTRHLSIISVSGSHTWLQTSFTFITHTHIHTHTHIWQVPEDKTLVCHTPGHRLHLHSSHTCTHVHTHTYMHTHTHTQHDQEDKMLSYRFPPLSHTPDTNTQGLSQDSTSDMQSWQTPQQYTKGRWLKQKWYSSSSPSHCM